MGLYYLPDGIVTKLEVKGPAYFDVSARVAGAFETVGSSELADASSDTIGFYGTAPIAAVASPDSPDASLTQLKTAVDSIEDKLTAYGLLRGT